MLLGAMATLLALSAIAAPATMAKGRPLQATLAGADEVPGPGDPDGAGSARLRLNQGRHRICYTIRVTGIEPAVAAHIHVGDAAVAGPVVVSLEPPDAVTGVVEACATGVERALIKSIRKHPADYYVNVHTADFEAGAIRGQLTKWAPGRP
jgi:hypothetical protein